MAWRTARSLLVLHAQLKAGSRAAPPATDPTEWGTIGDTVHNPSSDHTPHDFPGWGYDIVTAADFPNRPDLGLDARKVLDDIRRSRDPRAKYGISNGQMFSSYATSTYPAWTWRPYTGKDGHFTHGHLSVVGDARADGQQPWQTIGKSRSGSQHEEESMYFANVLGTDEVYLTNGLTARWVSAEEFPHLFVLHAEGTQPLTYNGAIRTVAFQSMVGDVVGNRPDRLGPTDEHRAILDALAVLSQHAALSTDQVHELVDAVIAAPNNRLTDADRPTLVAAATGTPSSPAVDPVDEI